MRIEITREQEQLVEQQLATGNFIDKGEDIGEALALLKRQGEALAEMREGFREAYERNAELDSEAELKLIENMLKENR